MPLQLLEHFLVMTDDVDATRDFYRDVLDFQEGFRPELEFLGYWLYLGDIPVIHIADWASYTAHSQRLGIPVTTRASSTGVFDHVAFNGTDADAMIRRLAAQGIPYERNDVPGIGLVQLFLNDPNGLKLELNYR
ncbi:MAG: VOC family protein [Pseudohongiellaceae bacterium]|jgi:catechol 2,3-dioxygenase-like lactoylglutathione lyase family enzyme